MSQSFSPTGSSERLVLLDALRGFAILGILAVNFYSYAWPFEAAFVNPLANAPRLDRLVIALVDFGFRAKFYTLFSFLFGLGLAMQLERCDRGGRHFTLFGPIRLLILLGIGFAHGLLLWFGDVLVMYALLGFGLLILLRAPLWLQIGAALASMGLYVLILLGLSLSGLPMGGTGYSDAYREAMVLYTSTDYPAMLKDRIVILMQMYVSLIIVGWQIFAIFLAGAITWRLGWLKRTDERRHLWTGVFAASLMIGLLANGLFAWQRFESPYMGIDPTDLRGNLLVLIGQLAFCTAMVTGFARFGGRWSRIFVPVGRTALSNYLLQSLGFTLIFYGYGLGLLGKVSPSLGLLLCLGFYGLQIGLSTWWLKRFSMGPAEWLWRKLTYGIYGLLSGA